DNISAWTALRADGYVALVRHAPAPGPVGDPSDYKLDDCATQRNLSEQGRAEARALGERFRTERVKVPLPADRRINEHRSDRTCPRVPQCFRTERHARRADGWGACVGRDTLVVVAHGENIVAMLGILPRQGEVIGVAPDPVSGNKMRLIGRIGSY